MSAAANRSTGFQKILLRILFLAALPAALLCQPFLTFVSDLERLPVDRRAPFAETYLAKTKSFPIIEKDSLLHFVYYGRAHTAGVNGNLQRWNEPDSMYAVDCGDSTLFFRSYLIPSDTRLDYQLVIDGTYVLDPRNPRTTPSGYGPHSEVRMPLFRPSPYRTPNDSVPKGTIEDLNLYLYLDPPLSHYTIFGRPLKAYLPPGYDTLRDLPVVYVNDGFEAIAYAGLPVVLDNLIAQKKIRPLIAIFIPPVARQEEYLTNAREKFMRVVCDEIVPMVDRRFRTSRKPEDRAVMGISNGAHFALLTVLNRPDLFLNGGGQSTTISDALLDITKRQAQAKRLPINMKLYLDCGRFDILRYNPVWGDIDFLGANRMYSDLLASLRVPHFFREVNDGHEWASWRERMPDMLMFFFGNFR